MDDGGGLQGAARFIHEDDGGEAVGWGGANLHDRHGAELAGEAGEEASAAEGMGQVPRPEHVIAAVEVVGDRLGAQHLTAEDVGQHRLVVVQVEGEGTALQRLKGEVGGKQKGNIRNVVGAAKAIVFNRRFAK